MRSDLQGFVYFVQEGPRLKRSTANYYLSDRRTAFVRASLGRPSPRGLIKIGFTQNLPLARIQAIGTRIKRCMTTLAVVEGSRKDERRYLRRFAHLAEREPFGTEWFRPDGELARLIANLPRAFAPESLSYDGRPRKRGSVHELLRVVPPS